MSRILPDHNQSFDDLIVEFSSDQINQLRKKYKFNKSYPLEEALNRVAMFHEQKHYYDSPAKVGEQRELFNAIKQSALTMEEAIKGLGRSELLLIGKQNCDWISHTKIDQIAEIRRVAERALIDLSKRSSPGGRPSKDTERRLIARLMRIYREGTGRSEHYSHNQYGGKKFTGRLVEFIEDIVKILDVSEPSDSDADEIISNNFIGKVLKELFKSKP